MSLHRCITSALKLEIKTCDKLELHQDQIHFAFPHSFCAFECSLNFVHKIKLPKMSKFIAIYVKMQKLLTYINKIVDLITIRCNVFTFHIILVFQHKMIIIAYFMSYSNVKICER